MSDSEKKQENYVPTESQSHDTPNPYNELEMQFMVTQPAWGREVTPELYNKVSKIMRQNAYTNEEGNLVIPAQPLWGLLSMYTRDLRLGNLNPLTGELEYCRYWLDYAGDLLRNGYPDSFLSALSRVITLLELSQSKSGFLRRRQGTVTTEKYEAQLKPNDNGILGGGRGKK